MRLKLNDVERGAIHKVGARINSRGIRKGCGIGPNRRFQIILRVLAASGQRIKVKSVSGSQDCLWINRPGYPYSWSKVVLDRSRGKEVFACQHYVGKMRI